MAKAILQITSPDFKAFAKQLRGVDDKKLKAKMRKRLRGVAGEAADAAKNAVMGLQVGENYHAQRIKVGRKTVTVQGTSKLRPAIRNAIGVSIRASGSKVGVSVVVRSNRMGKKSGGEKTLEFGSTHPMYGHDNEMVFQPATPFWRDAVRPYRAKSQAELAKVVDEISRELGFRG